MQKNIDEPCQLTDKVNIDELLSHLVAFSVAEWGAMGVEGQIILLTDQNKSYKTNYTYDKLAQNILEKLPVDHFFFNSPKKFNNSPKNQLGWEYTYLGCGNHLFMQNWLNTIFYQIVRKGKPTLHLYPVWFTITSHLIECAQIAGVI